MIREYTKFFINGGILGVIAWGLQLLIYRAIGSETSYAYILASGLTYLPLIVVNFLIQRRWIFKRQGMFLRFVIANLAIMALVSMLSPLCRYAINYLAGVPWGDQGGFIMAALLGSIPSFLLKRYWVFGKSLRERCNHAVLKS